MKILGIEAADRAVSVALMEDDKIIGEFTLNSTMNHSVTLMPLIDRMLDFLKVDIKDISYIAVSSGPGSFTGLRIGSATAKGLSFSLNIPIISVPTLDAMCFNSASYNHLICPLINARRGNAYTGLYKIDNDKKRYNLNIIKDRGIYSVDEILDDIIELKEEVMFVGSGIDYFTDLIEKRLTKYKYMPLNLRDMRASSVLYLAKIYLEKGILEDTFSHHPRYYRETYAKRQLDEKIDKQKTI